MRILLVSPDFPYPATHGGKVDIMRQIEVLAGMDVIVDLVICGKDKFNKENDEYVAKFVNSIIYAERTSSVFDNLSIIPYQAQSRKHLKDIVFKEKYDWVLVEGEYVMEILKNPTLSYSKTLLRVNNIEYKYFYNLFLSAFPKPSSLYYILDSAKLFFYSKRAFKQCNYLAFVSSEEMAWYNNKFPEAKNAYLLIQHFDTTKFIPYQAKTTNEVLFVGSLFMPNNVKGLKWYLENVHPLLLDIPGYNLKIIGSTGKDPSIGQKLRTQFAHIAQIEILPDVPDLNYYYNQASVFINPMLNGAGIKVKTLQAVQFGLPVVSTTVGAEGIGLENEKHLCISNDAAVFAENVKRNLTNRQQAAEMVNRAQDFLREIDGAKVLPKIIFGQ